MEQGRFNHKQIVLILRETDQDSVAVVAKRHGVDDYVHYYNNERIKLKLKGLSPAEYRMRNTA